MKRKSIEYVIQTFKKAGLELIDLDYKSVDSPLKCIDNEGYLYYRSLRTVEDNLYKKNLYNHKFSIKNKFFWENILHYMSINVNTGTILLTKKEDFINGDNKISFQCGECGLSFKTSWHNFVTIENKICPMCYKEKYFSEGTPEKRRVSMDKFRKIAKERNFIVVSNKIYGYHDKIDLEDQNGYRGRMSAARFLQGSNFERFSIRNPYTIYNLNQYAKNKKWDCFVPNQEFKGTDFLIDVKCGCGEIFSLTVQHFIDGKHRCNKCSMKESEIAKKVKEWLIDKNIDFIQEKSFQDCKLTNMPMYFDFYLPKYNACIEVDGIQHFKPITFGSTKEQSIENFNKTKERDLFKNTYCIENNIKLLRVPFWQIEKTEEYKDRLNDFIISLQE